MAEENGTGTPELNLIDIPSEYADAGFLASVRTDDGKLDVNKALKKLQNQESILGKRALPTKDSADADIDEFIEKMKAGNPIDDSIFDGIDSVKELKTVLKNAGVLPKQAKQILEAYKKDMNQQYSEDEFTQMLNENLTQEEVALAKKVMTEELWNDTMASRNKEAIGRLKLIAQVGKKYGAEEKGIGAGTPSNAVPSTKKGMCSEYVNEMMEAAARGATQKEKDAIMSKYGYNHELGGWDI